MTRTVAREIALGCIFECLAADAESDCVLKHRLDVPGTPDLASEDALYAEEPDDKAREYISFITGAAAEHRDELLNEIAIYAEGWKQERLSVMTRSILLLSMTEILYREDVPTATSINEAVELAKKYDIEKAPAFINGLLGRFVKARAEKSEC